MERLSTYQIIFVGILLVAMAGLAALCVAIARRGPSGVRSGQHAIRRESSLSGNTDIDISIALRKPFIVNEDLLEFE